MKCTNCVGLTRSLHFLFKCSSKKVNVTRFGRTSRRNGCRSSWCASYCVPSLTTTGMCRRILIRLQKNKFHVYPFCCSRGVIRGRTCATSRCKHLAHGSNSTIQKSIIHYSKQRYIFHRNCC